jgi:hypothetical protein
MGDRAAGEPFLKIILPHACVIASLKSVHFSFKHLETYDLVIISRRAYVPRDEVSVAASLLVLA